MSRIDYGANKPEVVISLLFPSLPIKSITIEDAVRHEANPIALAPEFRRALQRSQFPLIVLFMGYSRAGKSTRLNQILTKGQNLRLPGPSVARGGPDPVTVGFQVCGPIPFDKLNDLHGLGLTINPDRNPDVFLVDSEGIDHLDESSRGFGKAMFALAQISAVNVIVLPGLMSLKDIPPLGNLFRTSKMIQSAECQIETGFAVLEHGIDPGSVMGETLVDGTEAFEESRHSQDARRKKKVCEYLNQGNVRFAEANVIVLDQPAFDNEVSYWNSLHDLMRFWYTIALKTLILPGRMLVDVFRLTVMAIQKCPSWKTLNIDCGEILTALVRKQFVRAKRSTAAEFPELIDDRIEDLTVEQLKQIRKSDFVAAVQGEIVSLFQAKANESHPFVCESFCTLFGQFCDELRSEAASAVNRIYGTQCARTVLIDKAKRLLTKADNEIKREVERLQNDIGRVED
jgi:hypothetical protein